MVSNNWVALLTMLGAMILFLAWICENYFRKKWESQKEESDFMRQLGMSFDVILYTINSDILLYRYWYEKNKTDLLVKQNLLQSLYNYLICRYKLSTLISNQLALADKTYDKEYLRNEQDQMDATFDNLMTLAEEQNVIELTNIYYQQEHENDERLIQVNKYRLNFNKQTDFYNKVFLICYVVGSVFLALAFLVNFINQ